MKKIILLTVICLSGCAGSPPEPPQPEGEYRPVNITKTKTDKTAKKTGTFNFRFDGDIADALEALAAQQPQLEALPPQGQTTPVPVHIDLIATDLPNALKVIGEQGGGLADVVWLSTKSNRRGGKAYVRFLPQSENTDGELK